MTQKPVELSDIEEYFSIGDGVAVLDGDFTPEQLRRIANAVEDRQRDPTERLWLACRRFIDEKQIRCAETISQSDRVLEGADDFIEEICRIAGYYEG